MACRRRRIHRGRGLFSIGARVLGRVFKIATKTRVKVAKKASRQAMKKAKDINTWRKLTKKGIKSATKYGTTKLLNSQIDKKNKDNHIFNYMVNNHGVQS